MFNVELLNIVADKHRQMVIRLIKLNKEKLDKERDVASPYAVSLREYSRLLYSMLTTINIYDKRWKEGARSRKRKSVSVRRIDKGVQEREAK